MNNILVAYFSCTGYTKKLAEKINEKVQGDLFEIEPITPYTEEDLDWTKEDSRSTLEMKDPSNRPPVKNKVEDMDKYKLVFVGFPIWWGKAPTIVNTFLESYDLKDKIIIPFATYHSSGIGETDEYLKPSCKNADYRKAKGFEMNDLDHIDDIIG